MYPKRVLGVRDKAVCYPFDVGMSRKWSLLGINGCENEVNLIQYSGDLAPSSSGPGHLVLIQKIAGSTPAGVTLYCNFFYLPLAHDCSSG